MQSECIKCLQKQAERLFKKCHISDDARVEITSRFSLFIKKNENEDLKTPEVTRYLYHLIAKASGVSDIYEKEKAEYNDLMLSLEDELRMAISQSENPFYTALKYALAGNVIDFAPGPNFDIFKALTNATLRKPAIDHSGMLHDELKKAGTVLYLGDNAGEIVTDKLFIETMKHKNLFFAVRGGNIINDITEDDAIYIGMKKVARIISNGYDVPSTIPDKCSKRFQETYQKADLVISKGQGNLEGLLNEKGKNIFFLLTIKCDVMAQLIGAQKNDLIVVRNSA